VESKNTLLSISAPRQHSLALLPANYALTPHHCLSSLKPLVFDLARRIIYTACLLFLLISLSRGVRSEEYECI
jgi:hypothetical protein